MMKDDRGTAQTHQTDRTRNLLSPCAGPFLQGAYREMLDPPVIAVSIITVVGATLVYSVTGPMGLSDSFSTAQRLMLVGITTCLSWPFCHSLSTLVLLFMRRRKPYQILLACATAIPFMAIPCAAIAYTVFELFGRDAVGRLWDIYLNVTVWLAACCGVIHYTACLRARLRYTAEAAATEVDTAPRYQACADTPNALHNPDEAAASRQGQRPDSKSPEDHGDPIEATRGPIPEGGHFVPEGGHFEGNPRLTEPAAGMPEGSSSVTTGEDRTTAGSTVTEQPHSRFLDRLPEKLGRDVIYLNVSGHYVNAVTTEGAGVILMRFADAVAELGDMGMQVHRSYWVAHRHITGIFRRDERTMVRATGGHELPVSRTYLTAVRAFIPLIRKGQEPRSERSVTTKD